MLTPLASPYRPMPQGGSQRSCKTCKSRSTVQPVPADSPLVKAPQLEKTDTVPPLGKPLKRRFFDRSVHQVAPDLIGATLLFNGVGGVIVEVEAYHHTDPAAHSYNGPTPRNLVMFGPPGFAYVYRSYGIHWCVNFVCEKEGTASAVLIRALAPTHGLGAMRRRRGMQEERALCSGPGKLCEALGITVAHSGLPLDRAPFALHARVGEADVVKGVRIGITKAVDLPWRYGLRGSRYLSKPFPA
jgi:DNA-3-methyladenine glycosylase